MTAPQLQVNCSPVLSFVEISEELHNIIWAVVWQFDESKLDGLGFWGYQ